MGCCQFQNHGLPCSVRCGVVKFRIWILPIYEIGCCQFEIHGLPVSEMWFCQFQNLDFANFRKLVLSISKSWF
jgi:hypothetical protein